MADNITPESSSWNERVEYVRGLAQIVRDEGLSLIELKGQGWKITLKGPQAPVVTVAATTASETAPSYMTAPVAMAPGAIGAPVATAPAASAQENLVPVVTPMVGVFYRSPSPSDPPFVEVGDRVEAGQTIGLVEAMKVFNEITAESGGIVAKINVESGQLVETGAPLIMLRR